MAGRLKILLVEEARFFLAIEKQFLQKTPADLLEAISSDEAISSAVKNRPDLIYMSYNLRPLNGAECCRHLRQTAATRNIPVVMICDQDEPGQSRQSLTAGCNGILTKPLDRLRFIEVGREFLPGIRESRQTCLFQVEFSCDGDRHRGTCLDISTGGLFLDSHVDIPSGTLISLSFRLPNSDTGTIDCRGEVTWLNRKPNPMKAHYPVGFGVKFIDLPERTKQLISQDIKR